MSVLRHGGAGALLALLVSACAKESITDVSHEKDLGKLPSFIVAGASFIADFDPPLYAVGTIDGQQDWTSTGAAGAGCAVYDHEVVPNTYGYASFGEQSLRISNAVTSGCFGDHTFSKRTTNYVGETTSDCATFCLAGTRQSHLEAEWDFASTVPGAEQTGLSVVASPDRGDGSRMSWVQMTDTPSGLDINFFDVQGTTNPATFVGPTNIATGLSRTVPHRIRITMDLLDGPSNDIVKVYVDGALRHTGTSWENYFRFDTQDAVYPAVPAVNRILFRTGGTAAPGTLGNGFVIDSLSMATSNAAAAKDGCKNGGWQSLTRADGSPFKNQGDCIQYTNTGK